jgi:hypothetical protein
LGEIFPRKVPKFGLKIEVKSLESNYNVLVRKNFFPKKLSTVGGGCSWPKNFFSGKNFEIGAPKKIFPRAPAKPSAAMGFPGVSVI